MKKVDVFALLVFGLMFLSTAAVITYAASAGQSTPLAPEILNRLSSERLDDGTWTASTYAVAGNITELEINGTTVTQNWAGFYGNVTGVITLDDAQNNSMYQWSLTSPEGEIIAGKTQTITWETGLKCANQTTLELEEDRHQMERGDVDGVTETFLDSFAHNEFYIANFTFSSDACPAAQLNVNDSTYNNKTGTPIFQEIAIWDDNTNTMLWVSLLQEENPFGFDFQQHDFEMIVPENGSFGNTENTLYYFWVELE